MDRNYKMYLEQGDDFITERTARRHNFRRSAVAEKIQPNTEPALTNIPEQGIVYMECEQQELLSNVDSTDDVRKLFILQILFRNCVRIVRLGENHFILVKKVILSRVLCLTRFLEATNEIEATNQFLLITIPTKDDTHTDWANILINSLQENDVNIDEDDHLRPVDLLSFMSSQAFTEQITMPVDKTLGEVFLMLLKFSIANSLSVTAMTNLFKLINTVFARPILPNSRYFYEKLLNPKANVQFHAICPTCSKYIGEFGHVEHIKVCSKCKQTVNLVNPSDSSFFVLIDPSTQISDILQMHEEYYDYVVNERVHETNYIKDVYDGKLYRKFVESLPENEKHNYCSAVFNTDGAPIFKSSKYSIWPLFLKINELPPQERMSKLITCGLYFDNKKPEMPVFIDKFVDLINNVTRNKILCTIKGEERHLSLHILSCCVDSIARAPIQGIKQFNGEYGCNWCLHPGYYAKGTMKYPYLEPSPSPRMHNNTVKLMLGSTVDCPEGIKYTSPLINLHSFDIVQGFVPDYLHACLEGVGEQFTTYYVKLLSLDDIKRLDAEMSNIAAPEQVQRLSRPISKRKDYKAREWENFILYYSIPIFSMILNNELLTHWILFVEALYILLKDRLHIDELNYADRLLHKFVCKADGLFGIKCMSYNLHQLLHICESVLNWGPLWTNSTFSFESANYNLLKAIKCSRGVTQQIVRFVNVTHSLLVVEDVVGRQASEIIMNYCNDVLCARIKNITRTREIIYFGKGDDLQDDWIRDCNITHENSKTYLKIIKNRCLYESYLKSKSRSNNSFVQLRNKSFARIIGFVVDDNSKEELLLYNLLYTRNYNSAYGILQRVEYIDNDTRCVLIDSIERICVFMNVNRQEYIVPMPNLLHY